MNPPSGTEWRMWVAVCPYCECGFPTSNGVEFERLLNTHHCPQEDAA